MASAKKNKYSPNLLIERSSLGDVEVSTSVSRINEGEHLETLPDIISGTTLDCNSPQPLAETPKDLRKKLFRTRLRLDFNPLLSKVSNKLSRSKMYRINEESNETMEVEGQLVKLRVSSTSSSRSFRGEVCPFRFSTSSGSSNSIVSSMASTPDSPTPDIDNVFAKRIQFNLDSPEPMADVKELARKLNFEPVHHQMDDKMKEKFLESELAVKTFSPVIVESPTADHANEKSPFEGLSDEERKENLNKSMEWIRKELLAMRHQDQEIARQLIALRLEIQRLRLQQAVQGHKTILENVALEAEEEKEMNQSSCEREANPTWSARPTPAFLRDIGVTKMNLSSRRFSLR